MKAHQRNLRVGRHSLLNHYYHVTFTTKDRDPVFSELATARIAISALKFSDDNGHSKTQCFVVMPDHIHWLFQLTNQNLSQTVQRIKAMISRKLQQAVWQKGFHDHGIRNDESLKAISRYIIANPIRAGISKSVREYPYWDAVWI